MALSITSLTAEMETTFKTLWQAAKGEALPVTGEEDREILFSAISTAVLNHLKNNIDGALHVDVSTTQTNLISSSGSSVTVTQDSGNSNKATSTGSETNVSLEVNA